jgi:hypothetical protein
MMKHFIKILMREDLLERVVEKARYEGDMARGEFMTLSVEKGFKRLDRCLNVLKFQDPEDDSLLKLL